MDKIYLIDGANMIFRAFYALPILNNSKGQPTNAILGFAQMILKLLKERKPRYIAVVFDTKEPTFRDQMFKAYKANRKEPPDELIAQFEYFEPLVDALGIPILKMPGYEADDIIGTIVKKFSYGGMAVVIVSGDKDFFQLVGENVRVLDTMRDIEYDSEKVVEKMGVPPNLVVDVLALAGDGSDNIPGVRGVGIKTAVKLVVEHGGLDGVISSAPKLKGALGVKIREGIESARLSKNLATINCNVPIDVTISDIEFRGINKEKVKQLFTNLEFNKLLNQLSTVSV